MSKHGKYLLLLAGALLATSCVDETPLEVEEQLIEAVGDLPMQAQYQSTEDVDAFRPRLKVEFKIVGELSPNTPITVWIEAEATEAITGGEVEVALPTFAAMKLAGPDKPLRYVMGSKPPAVASWKLPAMEVGDTWKQTVKIGTIPEKGYYQVTANTQTHGPFESPYVFDESFHEAWMFVMDGGGVLTRMFDETIFPEQLIPQPGPFQSKGQHAAGSADYTGLASDMVSAKAPSRVYARFYHLDQHRNYNPMIGAEVTADYIERGQASGHTKRIVPQGGIVSYACPGNREQRLVGAARNRTTARVLGGHHLAYFEARYSQCGDTVHVLGSRHHYIPWRNLDSIAIPRITTVFGYSRRAVKFKYSSRRIPVLQSRWASYDPRADEITFRDAYGHVSVAGHEYTHALHNKALGGTWYVPLLNCAGHRHHIPSSYKCALKEGLAAFGGQVAADSTGAGWEDFHRHPSPLGRGAGEIEGNVAALFYDLLDANNEHGDKTTYPASYVFGVLKTCRTPNDKRDDTADFVWCLERQVVDSVHKRHFPGLSPPSGVRELATEPANWKLDDIRSTWIWNVGRSGG